MKVVINKCYGGFGLSKEALKEYEFITGQTKVYDGNIPRDDAVLVEIVERLGKAADGFLGELKVVEIPDGVQWNIEEYDGIEWIAEAHETWG